MSKQASGRIRLSAEEIYAQELSALVAGDKFARPANWRLSPKAIVTYILGGKAAAQIFLVIDPSIGDEAEDLAVAKCFSRIHRVCNYASTCIFIHRFPESVNENRSYRALMQVSQQVSTRTLDFAG